MKQIIISAIIGIFSLHAFAAGVEWREIESKKCDDQAAVSVQDESVAIVQEQALLAFKRKDESGCNYADFYSVLTLTYATVNGSNTAVLQPIQAIARKNCRNEVSEAPAAFFSMVTSYENKLELQNAQGCKILVLNLKPKVSSTVESN